MSLNGIDKLGISHLSCGLDDFDWTEAQEIFRETFLDSNVKLTVHSQKTPPERTTFGDHNTATDLQKAQTTDTESNQVLTWKHEQPRPSPSHLQGLPHNIWKLWSLFNELLILRGIFCQRHEKLKTSQMTLQQVVSPALVQDILHSLHSDHTSVHLGVTNILENLRSSFY